VIEYCKTSAICALSSSLWRKEFSQRASIMAKPALDAADKRILRSLQRNNVRPHREIADEVGLSVAAVARRIQRLRETKIITADVSIVDQSAVGRPLTLIVEVASENERLDLLDRPLEARARVDEERLVHLRGIPQPADRVSDRRPIGQLPAKRSQLRVEDQFFLHAGAKIREIGR